MEHSRKNEIFSASKGLETFHGFVAPYVNTVATADADSQ